MNKLSLYLLLAILIVAGYFYLNQDKDISETNHEESHEREINAETAEDIKGSFTLLDIEENFGLPVETMVHAFLIEDQSPETFVISALDTYYEELDDLTPPIEIGVGSVKYFVGLYLGHEISPSYLPSEAIELLIKEGKITRNHDALNYAVDLNKPQVLVELEHEEKVINGNTSIQDLLDYGFTYEYFQDLFGNDSFTTSDLVKDVARKVGLKFSEVKVIIENDAKK